MSRLWRDELRVGLCPDRLVVARRAHRWSREASRAVHPAGGDAAAALAGMAARARVHVVLSNHYVRYAVLPWSRALTSEADWLAFAQHSFQSTYGAALAAGWRVKLSPAGRRKARVACAVDAAMLDSLRAVPGVASIRPYLMAAFNGRRRAVARGDGWFVTQEPGRLTVSLIVGGEWRMIRARQAGNGWQAMLPELLDRELAASDEPAAGTVMLCSEGEPPGDSQRYRIVDVTLPRGAKPELRPYAMTLQ